MMMRNGGTLIAIALWAAGCSSGSLSGRDGRGTDVSGGNTVDAGGEDASVSGTRDGGGDRDGVATSGREGGSGRDAGRDFVGPDTGATTPDKSGTSDTGGATPDQGGATPDKGGAIPDQGATPDKGATPDTAVSPVSTKLIDSSSNGYGYAYAPSIIYEGGLYYMFYCSGANAGGVIGPDVIRLATSPDRVSWGNPQIVLSPTSASSNETHACDPSVIKFQGNVLGIPDASEYWYLYYTGFHSGVGSVVFVARSLSISGPYQKWTGSGWVQNATNPKHILGPAVAHPDSSGYYGAGEQSLIMTSSQLQLWYYDDSACPTPSPTSCPIVRKTPLTSDPTYFLPGQLTNVENPWAMYSALSPEVRFNAYTNQYQMFFITDPLNLGSRLAKRSSSDGITWGGVVYLTAPGQLPSWSHNVGVQGDRYGKLTNYYGDTVPFQAYGAPYDAGPNSWGKWDLYGSFLSAP